MFWYYHNIFIHGWLNIIIKYQIEIDINLVYFCKMQDLIKHKNGKNNYQIIFGDALEKLKLIRLKV